MFICRVNRNKEACNSRKKQKQYEAISKAIVKHNETRDNFYKLEKGHAKQIERITYTRPSSGICKGRQSTIIPIEIGIELWLKETQKQGKRQ